MTNKSSDCTLCCRFQVSLMFTGELSWQSLSFWNQGKLFLAQNLSHFQISQLPLPSRRERGSLNVNTDLLMENIKACEVIWEKNYLQNDLILKDPFIKFKLGFMLETLHKKQMHFFSRLSIIVSIVRMIPVGTVSQTSKDKLLKSLLPP